MNDGRNNWVDMGSTREGRALTVTATVCKGVGGRKVTGQSNKP